MRVRERSIKSGCVSGRGGVGVCAWAVTSLEMRSSLCVLMRRISSSVALVLLAAACGQHPDLTDVTGARAVREVVGSGYGLALPGASLEEQAELRVGLAEFQHNRDPSTGLGPVMNAIACQSCHDSPPAIGGTTGRLETRFGRRNPDGSFDPLISLGGPTLQDEAIGKVNGFSWAPETVPPSANVVAQRRTTPVFGLGLVEATPDATFIAIAVWQRAHHPEVAGRPARVRDLVKNADAVGRFGWKASFPTLLQFSADAFLNEMGITTPMFPEELCPGGDCSLLAHNPAPGINDPDGAALTRITNFMTHLGPPPPAADPSSPGAQVFGRIGCGVCHQQTLVTGTQASAALDRVAYHPFSDFLLHDMGALGDGIDQGDAKGAEMRTAPLWGLSIQHTFLHDGRAKSIDEAILAHDGQGKAARDLFTVQPAPDRAALLAFLQSL